MIAIVRSIYSQSVHALALNAGLMDNDAEPLTKKRITLFDKKITTQKKSKLAHLRLLSKSNRL